MLGTCGLVVAMMGTAFALLAFLLSLVSLLVHDPTVVSTLPQLQLVSSSTVWLPEVPKPEPVEKQRSHMLLSTALKKRLHSYLQAAETEVETDSGATADEFEQRSGPSVVQWLNDTDDMRSVLTVLSERDQLWLTVCHRRIWEGARWQGSVEFYQRSLLPLIPETHTGTGGTPSHRDSPLRPAIARDDWIATGRQLLGTALELVISAGVDDRLLLVFYSETHQDSLSLRSFVRIYNHSTYDEDAKSPAWQQLELPGGAVLGTVTAATVCTTPTEEWIIYSRANDQHRFRTMVRPRSLLLQKGYSISSWQAGPAGPVGRWPTVPNDQRSRAAGGSFGESNDEWHPEASFAEFDAAENVGGNHTRPFFGVTIGLDCSLPLPSAPEPEPGRCWQAHRTDYSCRGYSSAGYTCVGDQCAAINPRGNPHECAQLAPAGYVVDQSTGRCVSSIILGYAFVGVGFCRGGSNGDEYVNGRVKDGLASEANCADACNAEEACVGYGYFGAGLGIDAKHFGRCFLHGSGLERDLPKFDLFATAWAGSPEFAVEISNASGPWLGSAERGMNTSAAVCRRKRKEQTSEQSGEFRPAAGANNMEATMKSQGLKSGNLSSANLAITASILDVEQVLAKDRVLGWAGDHLKTRGRFILGVYNLMSEETGTARKPRTHWLMGQLVGTRDFMFEQDAPFTEYLGHRWPARWPISGWQAGNRHSSCPDLTANGVILDSVSGDSHVEQDQDTSYGNTLGGVSAAAGLQSEYTRQLWNSSSSVMCSTVFCFLDHIVEVDLMHRTRRMNIGFPTLESISKHEIANTWQYEAAELLPMGVRPPFLPRLLTDHTPLLTERNISTSSRRKEILALSVKPGRTEWRVSAASANPAARTSGEPVMTPDVEAPVLATSRSSSSSDGSSGSRISQTAGHGPGPSMDVLLLTRRHMSEHIHGGQAVRGNEDEDGSVESEWELSMAAVQPQFEPVPGGGLMESYWKYTRRLGLPQGLAVLDHRFIVIPADRSDRTREQSTDEDRDMGVIDAGRMLLGSGLTNLMQRINSLVWRGQNDTTMYPVSEDAPKEVIKHESKTVAAEVDNQTCTMSSDNEFSKFDAEAVGSSEKDNTENTENTYLVVLYQTGAVAVFLVPRQNSELASTSNDFRTGVVDNNLAIIRLPLQFVDWLDAVFVWFGLLSPIEGSVLDGGSPGAASAALLTEHGVEQVVAVGMWWQWRLCVGILAMAVGWFTCAAAAARARRIEGQTAAALLQPITTLFTAPQQRWPRQQQQQPPPPPPPPPQEEEHEEGPQTLQQETGQQRPASIADVLRGLQQLQRER